MTREMIKKFEDAGCKRWTNGKKGIWEDITNGCLYKVI